MVDSIIISANDKEILIDKDDSPYILDSIAWGSPAISFSSFKFPMQVGEQITSTSIGSRDIQITGYIVGDSLSQIEARKDFLSRTLLFESNVAIILNDKIIKGVPCDIVKFGEDSSVNNEAFCKFYLSLLCEDPRFYDKNFNFVSMSTESPSFFLPLSIEDKGLIFSERKISKTIKIENKGTSKIGIIVKLKAKGNVINPKIVNVDTNQSFLLNKTLSFDEQVIIDTRIGSRNIVGKTSDEFENYYKFKNIDSDWIDLKIGSNTLVYSADSGSDLLEVVIEYLQAYMNIKEL